MIYVCDNYYPLCIRLSLCRLQEFRDSAYFDKSSKYFICMYVCRLVCLFIGSFCCANLQSQKPAKPWVIDAYGMGNMNGNGWNHDRKGLLLTHDLNKVLCLFVCVYRLACVCLYLKQCLVCLFVFCLFVYCCYFLCLFGGLFVLLVGSWSDLGNFLQLKSYCHEI